MVYRRRYLDLLKWDHLGIWNKDVSDDELLTAVLKETAICDAMETARLAEKLRLVFEEINARRAEEEAERLAEASRQVARTRADAARREEEARRAVEVAADEARAQEARAAEVARETEVEGTDAEARGRTESVSSGG